MFTDKSRAEVQDELRRRDQALFAHILTPELFLQAARLCKLPLIRSPLNLINLVWLAVRAARSPDLCFADILTLSLKPLQDHESFPGSALDKLLGVPGQTGKKKSRHDPRKSPAETVSEVAFSKARQRMPSEFWVALLLLLAEQFQRRYADVIRWRRFRLLALDGSDILLPDWPALREHFGTANNSGGTHGAQARLVLLQFPQARLPYAYAVEPIRMGETSMARQLLQGLRRDDLILLDAGFLCYGLLYQIQHQHASFCLRLRKNLNLRFLEELLSPAWSMTANYSSTPRWAWLKKPASNSRSKAAHSNSVSKWSRNSLTSAAAKFANRPYLSQAQTISLGFSCGA